MFGIRIIDKAHIAQFSLKIEIMIQRVPLQCPSIRRGPFESTSLNNSV